MGERVKTENVAGLLAVMDRCGCGRTNHADALRDLVDARSARDVATGEAALWKAVAAILLDGCGERIDDIPRDMDAAVESATIIARRVRAERHGEVPNE